MKQLFLYFFLLLTCFFVSCNKLKNDMLVANRENSCIILNKVPFMEYMQIPAKNTLDFLGKCKIDTDYLSSKVKQVGFVLSQKKLTSLDASLFSLVSLDTLHEQKNIFYCYAKQETGDDSCIYIANKGVKFGQNVAKMLKKNIYYVYCWIQYEDRLVVSVNYKVLTISVIESWKKTMEDLGSYAQKFHSMQSENYIKKQKNLQKESDKIQKNINDFSKKIDDLIGSSDIDYNQRNILEHAVHVMEQSHDALKKLTKIFSSKETTFQDKNAALSRLHLLQSKIQDDLHQAQEKIDSLQKEKEELEQKNKSIQNALHESDEDKEALKQQIVQHQIGKNNLIQNFKEQKVLNEQKSTEEIQRLKTDLDKLKQKLFTRRKQEFTIAESYNYVQYKKIEDKNTIKLSFSTSDDLSAISLLSHSINLSPRKNENEIIKIPELFSFEEPKNEKPRKTLKKNFLNIGLQKTKVVLKKIENELSCNMQGINKAKINVIKQKIEAEITKNEHNLQQTNTNSRPGKLTKKCEIIQRAWQHSIYLLKEVIAAFPKNKQHSMTFSEIQSIIVKIKKVQIEIDKKIVEINNAKQ